MKIAIFLAAFVAVALARPQHQHDVQIVRQESDNIGVGGYSHAFETSDGTSVQESGQLKNEGSENEAMAVQGAFSWVAPDGQQFQITYIADENGFQPQGAHLPK